MEPRERIIPVRIKSVVPGPGHIGPPPQINYCVESRDPNDRLGTCFVQPKVRPCDDQTYIRALPVGMHGYVVVTPEGTDFYPQLPETIMFEECP